MSHDYANKYANYWSKKNKTIKSGKSTFKDSGRQKTPVRVQGNTKYKCPTLEETKNGACEEKRRAQFKTLNWKEIY